MSKLPAPRLQLRWTKAGEENKPYLWECHYELVLPLQEHDVRAEVYDLSGDFTGKKDELVVQVNPPTLRGGLNGIPCTNPDGSRCCDSPFRDGAHARWDSAVLGGIPVFVIAPDGMHFAKQD